MDSDRSTPASLGCFDRFKVMQLFQFCWELLISMQFGVFFKVKRPLPKKQVVIVIPHQTLFFELRVSEHY